MGRGAREPVLGVPDRTESPRCKPGDPRLMPPTVLSWAPMVAKKRQWPHSSTPATQPAAPPTTRPGRNTSEAGTPCGASQERGGGRVGGGDSHYPRPLPLVKTGVRAEWLTALHGRGSARDWLLWRLCVASGGSLWLLGLFCPREENKMSPQ